MYSSVLEVETMDPESLLKAMAPELKKSEWERSSFSFEKHKDKVIFTIKAKDIAALRANLNMITQLLMIYDKTKKLVRSDVL